MTTRLPNLYIVPGITIALFGIAVNSKEVTNSGMGITLFPLASFSLSWLQLAVSVLQRADASSSASSHPFVHLISLIFIAFSISSIAIVLAGKD